jgi:uncharacterized protein (TIGR02145 family)
MLEGSQGNNEYGIDPSPLKNIQYFDELEKIKFKPGNTEKKDNKRLHYVLLASGVIVLLVFILALSDYSGTSLLNNHSISIGGQRWMDKNLDVSEFSNGDLINEAATNEEWILAANEHRPAWCYYNNDSSNHRTTGRLYNWYAVIDPRGLAPKGWHIPKKNEWEEFIKRLEENHNNSAVIKSIGGWGMSSAEATGSTHFDALPTGCRDFNGLFIGGGCYANFWASNFNYVFQVSCMDSSFSLESHSGKWGFSVRCLQN